MTTGTGSTASTSAADAKTFWTDIAPKFANYTNVFYEIFNEPIDYQKTWATIKPVVQDIVTTVRAAAPQNVIIVPNNTWDQKPGDAASDPPAGTNLMYTAHIYASNWTASGAFQDQITMACGKAPVFITEWGYANSDANYQTFASTLQSSVDSEGASFTAWVTDNAWTPSMFTDATFTTLTTFGTQVKTWLAAKATSDWVN
jgi:endoglucanase